MRIALAGTHSSGKSELIRELKLPYHRIDEIARSEIKRLWKLPHEMTDSERLMFQLNLFNKQIEEEDKYKQFISDRSLFDIIAYWADVFGVQLTKMLLEQVRYMYDLILATPIQWEMQDDGIRKVDEVYRIEIQKRIFSYIKEYHAWETSYLYGHLPEKKESAILHIQSLLWKSL